MHGGALAVHKLWIVFSLYFSCNWWVPLVRSQSTKKSAFVEKTWNKCSTLKCVFRIRLARISLSLSPSVCVLMYVTLFNRLSYFSLYAKINFVQFETMPTIADAHTLIQAACTQRSYTRCDTIHSIQKLFKISNLALKILIVNVSVGLRLCRTLAVYCGPVELL